MKRLGGVVLGIAMIAAVSCSNEGSRPSGPPCEFAVGDAVTRDGIGALVPPRGETVSGHADGVSFSSEITITTSREGVVTITGSKDGDPITPETCVLP